MCKKKIKIIDSIVKITVSPTLCLAGLLIILLLNSCSSSKIITDTDEKKAVFLSEVWSNSDSRFIAGQFISDLISRDWLNGFIDEKGKNPTIFIVVENLTEESINIPLFVNNLSAELGKSGMVDIINIPFEGGHSNQHSIKKAESEADYRLGGTITQSMIEVHGEHIKAYYVELELFDMENNLAVWIGTKEIRKLGVTSPL